MIARAPHDDRPARDGATFRPASRSPLRRSLRREGVRYVPDRSPEPALQRLRGALRDRAGDARFWTETARLAADEVARVVGGDSLDRDLLRGRVIGGVLIGLRGAVHSDAPLAAWLAALPEAGRLAFFVVAVAAGPDDEAAGRRVAPWARRLFRAACDAGSDLETAGLLAVLALRTATDLRDALDARAPWTLPDLASAVAWLTDAREGVA